MNGSHVAGKKRRDGALVGDVAAEANGRQINDKDAAERRIISVPRRDKEAAQGDGRGRIVARRIQGIQSGSPQ